MSSRGSGACGVGLLCSLLLLLMAVPAATAQEELLLVTEPPGEAAESQVTEAERGVLGLPPDWSTDGHHIDQLIVFIHGLMALLMVGWTLYFVYCLWRFRAGARRDDDDEVPSAPRGRLALSLAFAVFAVEVALMVFVEIPLWARRSAPPPEDALVVRAVGEQYAWNFHYPGEDGVFGDTSIDRIDGFNPLGLDWDDPAAADDLITVNEMHVPLGVPIRVQLSSKDVIHGFYLPHFRVKQDALPGQSVEITFRPARAGRSEIGCAQLCGLGHYRMRGYLTVEDPEAFAAWYEEEMAYM